MLPTIEDKITIKSRDEEAQYELTSAMCSLAESTQGGHYILFQKVLGMPLWKEINDARVANKPFNDISETLNKHAVALLYKKIE